MSKWEGEEKGKEEWEIFHHERIEMKRTEGDLRDKWEGKENK